MKSLTQVDRLIAYRQLSVSQESYPAHKIQRVLRSVVCV